jgi:hypothetical protein
VSTLDDYSTDTTPINKSDTSSVDDDMSISTQSSASDAENPKKRKLDTEDVEMNGPVDKRVRIVKGVEIPIPKLLSVTQKVHIPARVLKARLKQQRRDELTIARWKAREEAMASGAFDWEADAKKKKERRIDREVKAEIRRRELAEEFGPVLPSPADLLRMEKDAEKAGPERFHQTELCKLSIKVHGVRLSCLSSVSC